MVPFVNAMVFLPDPIAQHVLSAPELMTGAFSIHTLIGRPT